MKDKLRVLSIDFDYFQKVDIDTLSEYPDGHDFGTEFSKQIWASHYAHPYSEEKILKVEVDEDKLDIVKGIIENSYNVETKVLICNSHANIFNFIEEEYEQDTYDGVEVYNLDMHHDMFDEGALGCGNWVYHVLKEFPNSEITWVMNPISEEAFGLDEKKQKKFAKVTDDLDVIDYMEFDLIFVCRSDMWTPPHLDSYFRDFAFFIATMYDNALAETVVLDERDCSEEIKLLKQSYAQVLGMSLGKEKQK